MAPPRLIGAGRDGLCLNFRGDVRATPPAYHRDLAGQPVQPGTEATRFVRIVCEQSSLGVRDYPPRICDNL
jgi:hypothetical protein